MTMPVTKATRFEISNLEVGKISTEGDDSGRKDVVTKNYSVCDHGHGVVIARSQDGHIILSKLKDL